MSKNVTKITSHPDWGKDAKQRRKPFRVESITAPITYVDNDSWKAIIQPSNEDKSPLYFVEF